MKPVVFLVINSLYGGGAEHVASRLSKEWSKRYNLKVITLQSFTDKDYDFYGEKISIEDKGKSFFWFLRMKQFALEIDNLAKQYSPIAIVSFLQNSNFIVLNTKYITRKIVSVRNYLPSLHKGFKKIIWNFLIKSTYNKADYVVSVSQLMNEAMTSVYGIEQKKCICIYNPYEIEEIQELSCEELIGTAKVFYDNHIVISSMGHVKYPKGHYHLVRMLPELIKKFPNIGLVIIGDDNTEYARKLKEMSKELKVIDNIYFTGRQKNPYKYLKRSNCYVFPSLFEGFPNALVEAMICGLPVISADCKSGPREILSPELNNQYGILLPSDNKIWLSSDKPLTELEKKYIVEIDRMITDSHHSTKYSELALKRSSDFKISSILNNWYKLIEE